MIPHHVRGHTAAATLEPGGQPPLEGLENLPRQSPRWGGGAVHYWRNRSASPRPPAEEPPALWAVEEIPAAEPEHRPCADRAWPTHRALHLVGLGQIVLSASPYTAEADLADTWCNLRQDRRKHDTTGGFFGLAEENAVRELERAGLVALGRRLIRVRSGRYFFTARRVELTPAGRALWQRWAHLVDPQIRREAELATAMHVWRLRNR
ncbi:hypothetical protein [Amycolatopsis keratiniphila]|uniref:Uncharacterized protein n=1 Tax=Amycolatopsis keratiniphila subsp. keratiniphila TaxID=227715 RepID=A0A1W2M214_9PSEU|nr:hypothetical protein [Amycolatopsis keratiniphila]ONF73926.1 hypothetical protein AVR91_0204135 [Amycolatopsis keratiniphila subsp. keratiniphila]